jgi:hypothetical protein
MLYSHGFFSPCRAGLLCLLAIGGMQAHPGGPDSRPIKSIHQAKSCGFTVVSHGWMLFQEPSRRALAVA